jgi:hypothetical protein
LAGFTEFIYLKNLPDPDIAGQGEAIGAWVMQNFLGIISVMVVPFTGNATTG